MFRITVRIGLLLALLTSCGRSRAPATPPPHEPPAGAEAPAAADVDGKPDGSACVAAAECSSGVCEGQGCDDGHPGTCAPAWAVRQCLADQTSYCGCDGVTFAANVGCPGRRFDHEGACGG